MGQTIEKKHVRILLARTPLTPVEKIKIQLDKTIGLNCVLVECANFSKCLDFLKSEGSDIDIVLLDMALVSVEDSETFFLKIRSVAEGKPIVVFTRQEDHELALFLVRGGASVVHEETMRRIESQHLRDVVEYAWIRHSNQQHEREIHETKMADQQKSHDADFEYERAQSADRLKLRDWTISRLKKGNSANQFKEGQEPEMNSRNYSQSLEERHSKAMIHERQKSTDALLAEKEAGAERLRDKDQIIAWLRGSYSQETSPVKPED